MSIKERNGHVKNGTSKKEQMEDAFIFSEDETR